MASVTCGLPADRDQLQNHTLVSSMGLPLPLYVGSSFVTQRCQFWYANSSAERFDFVQANVTTGLTGGSLTRLRSPCFGFLCRCRVDVRSGVSIVFSKLTDYAALLYMQGRIYTLHSVVRQFVSRFLYPLCDGHNYTIRHRFDGSSTVYQRSLRSQ